VAVIGKRRILYLECAAGTALSLDAGPKEEVSEDRTLLTRRCQQEVPLLVDFCEWLVTLIHGVNRMRHGLDNDCIWAAAAHANAPDNATGSEINYGYTILLRTSHIEPAFVHIDGKRLRMRWDPQSGDGPFFL
jgi:hypothetical protein